MLFSHKFNIPCTSLLHKLRYEIYLYSNTIIEVTAEEQQENNKEGYNNNSSAYMNITTLQI